MPTAKNSQETSAGACSTPTTGTIRLPTTGMNQAGLKCAISKCVCRIQMESTTSVNTRFAAAPTAHR